MTIDLALISGEAFDNNYSGSLADYINDLLLANPKGQFVEITENDASVVLSYKEAKNLSDNILANFQQRNLPLNTKIIVCVDKAVDFVPISWACICGGYSFIPWSSLQLSRNKQAFSHGLSNLIKSVKPAILVTTSEINEKIQSLASDIPTYFKNDLASLKPPVGIKPVSGNTGEILVSSSGTTGTPKLVRISYSIFLNRYLKPIEKNSHNKLFCLPLHSISGLSFLLPSADKTLYFQPNYLAACPEKLLNAISLYKVRRVGLSPYIIQMLIKSMEVSKNKYDLKSLDDVFIGSDFIDLGIISNFAQSVKDFGSNCDFTFIYGMTESGPVCFSKINISEIDNNFSDDGFANLGSCTSSWNLRITKQDEVLNENETGNIEIFSSYKLFSGYYGDNKNLFLKDGWFKTGDKGYIHNKALYITGREKSILTINSKKIALEQIENILKKIKNIDNQFVFAQKIRSASNLQDELLIYYVPTSKEKEIILSLKSEIKKELATNFDVSAKSIQAIEEGDIPRTVMGKVERKPLLENSDILGSTNTNEKVLNKTHAGVESYISFLWVDILQLEKKPEASDNFFELGADSLALAVFVSTIEQHYEIILAVEELLENLDFVDICKLVKIKQATNNLVFSENTTATDFERIRKIETMMIAWKGEKLSPDSLIVGKNTQGKRTPLFWVFQNYEEFNALANALGKNQPVYGMKSYSSVLAVKDYSHQNIQGLVDRYLWEILALLPIKQPIVLGANCQGGMIALEIAKKLSKAGRPPILLVLMEWSFKFGEYKLPTLFLYGKDSYTSSIYEKDKPSIDWKENFPNHKLCKIEGTHGEFFCDDNLTCLANTLRSNLNKINKNWHGKLSDFFIKCLLK